MIGPPRVRVFAVDATSTQLTWRHLRPRTSRIKVATIALDDTPVLVFDEVDSGIGGAVAEIVGRKLRQLGRRRQVLCVTHLPQVAACAHHQYRVSRLKSEDRT